MERTRERGGGAEHPVDVPAPKLGASGRLGHDGAGDGAGVPGDAQTKHPDESYSDFFSRKGRFTHEQAKREKGKGRGRRGGRRRRR